MQDKDHRQMSVDLFTVWWSASWLRQELMEEFGPGSIPLQSEDCPIWPKTSGNLPRTQVQHMHHRHRCVLVKSKTRTRRILNWIAGNYRGTKAALLLLFLLWHWYTARCSKQVQKTEIAERGQWLEIPGIGPPLRELFWEKHIRVFSMCIHFAFIPRALPFIVQDKIR